MYCRSLLLFVAFVTTGWAQSPIRVDDLYRFDAPTSAVLSPKLSPLVYVRQWIDRATKQERQSLWMVEVSADKARAVEEGEPDARGPVFSPDGKWVAFRSTRPRPNGWKQTPPVPPESEPATDIWLLRVADSSVAPLAGPDKPYGRVFGDAFYARLAFSPDSRRLAFVADDGVDPRTPEEIANDVLIVRPDQGENYTGYQPAQIWVADIDPIPKEVEFRARKIERLTNDDVWYGDPQWSPDGQTIVVHANRTDDRESVRFSINKNFDLWAIDVATRELRQLTNGPGPEVSPRFAPNGATIVALSSPRKGPHSDVYNPIVVHLKRPLPNQTTLIDFHADDRQPPTQYPAFPLPDAPFWPSNGEFIRYSSWLGTATEVLETGMRKPGEVRRLPPSEGVYPEDAQRRKLLPKANSFLAERVLGETRVVKWRNEDLELEGLLTTPPAAAGFRPPYKLLLLPHGGPHSRSSTGFQFVPEVFAAQGYAVFQPNFRGSQGYGKKFLDADRGDFGGGDMRDILTGIEHLVSEKLVDPERQFVYGTSYGGFLTCWLVGHTHQFRAAVAQNAVTDLNAMWGLSDIPSWTEWEFQGKPWEVPEAMRKHSPLTYVDQVRTPTLILHARDDRRCPLPMGQMFYSGLRSRSVPTQMVIYPREGHGIREPRHREDVLRRVLAWFEQFDKK